MKRKAHETFSRAVMKLICLLLAMVLVLMLGATALFRQVLGKLHYTQPAGDFGTRLGAFVTNLSQNLPDSAGELIGGTGSGIVNLLLIGSDQRVDEAARSDTMLLLTYHRKTGDITITSFLRDMYVPIPGYGSNRINTAYYQGGIRLLDETLKTNFDLHIDGNIQVDFSQFSDIIDLLGGVEIDLRADEAAEINSHTGWNLTEGRQNLTGWEALIYARIRKLDDDGDFSRTQRQRKLLNALLERYRSIKWRDLLKLMDQLLPLITTDLNYGQIVLLAMEILPKLPDCQVTDQRIPANGTFRDETVNGMAVLTPDLEANREFLRRTLLE